MNTELVSLCFFLLHFINIDSNAVIGNVKAKTLDYWLQQ